MSTKTQAGKFLEKLNIRRRSKPFRPRIEEDVNSAHDDQLRDPMGVKGMDALFASEEAAAEVLSSDHERLVSSMLRINDACSRGAPKTIADLGGGSGVVSLWLATQNPAYQVRVYDRSSKSLEIGRKWAEKLGLAERVTFHFASYEELAASERPPRDCDFVFAEYAATFDDYIDVFGESTQTQEFVSVNKRYHDLVKALRSLLADDGVGSVGSGNINPWTLQSFMGAVRASELYLDWSFMQPDGIMTVYLRVGESHLFETPEDDALTMLTLGQIKSHRQLWPAETLSLLKVFRAKGTAYLRVQMRGISPEGGERLERCEIEIWQLGGVCLLMERWESGTYRGIYHTAASMPALAELSMKTVHGPGSKPEDVFVDDRLAKLMKTTGK